jgi:hypothetical protein
MKAERLDKPVDDNFFNREMKDLVAVRERVHSGSLPENESITEVAGLLSSITVNVVVPRYMSRHFRS